MRGKILRDTSQGDGILFLDGKQKSFSLEKHWKSPNPPKVGATVEATVDEAGELVSVVEVKQAAVLKETALKAGAEFSSQGLSMLKKSKLPPVLLWQVGLLLLSWLFLPLLHVEVPIIGLEASASVYDFLNFGYFILMMICALLPLLPAISDKPAAQLGKCAPALFSIWMIYIVLNGLSQLVGIGDSFFGRRARVDAFDLVASHMSMGLGFYLASIIVIMLFFSGLKGYFREKKARKQGY